MDSTPLVLNVDGKTAVVVRIGTFKERTKLYIQGGYIPGEEYTKAGNPLMVEPTPDFPDGLAFGKAVTFPPSMLKDLIVLLQRFMLTTEYLQATKKTTSASTPTPAATAPKAKAKAKPKATTLGSNRIAPAATAEEEPEF